MFGLLSPKNRPNGASPEAIGQCDALLGDLAGRMADNSASRSIRNAIQSTIASEAGEKIDRLAATYLLAERHLTAADSEAANAVDELRASVRARYPALQSLAEFSVITAPRDEQSLALARGFLQAVIASMPTRFRAGRDENLVRLSKWLGRLPNPDDAHLPFEGLSEELAKIGSLSDRLRAVSKRLHVWACERFGDRAAETAFERAYQEYVNHFRALDAFEIVVSMLPAELLSESHVDALNRRQIERILIDKTAHYRELSEELSQRNAEMEAAKTALEAAKQESDESAKLLNIVLRTVAEGIVAMDSHGKIMMVNPSFERIWGYTEDEVKGKALTDIMPEAHRDPVTGLNRFFDTRASTLSGVPLELEGLRKNGQPFPLGITLSKALIDGETIFTALVQDITMRKFIEDDLTGAKDELQERVDERTKDLLETQAALIARAQELEQTNHELEQFAYVASHDLQEPLRTIISFIQILDRKFGDQFGEDGKEYMGFVVDGAKRMQDLINELLEYSRAGRVTRAMSQVDLNGTLGFVEANLFAKLEETGGKIEADKLPTVLGDSRQLLQLFQNLVDNAIKFKSKTPPVVKFTAKELPDAWEFHVSDNGIGIEDKYKDRVFIIFQRLHTRDAYEGNGIGLAICKKIVQRHGGEIWLDPDTETGCSFGFRLAKTVSSEAGLVG